MSWKERKKEREREKIITKTEVTAFPCCSAPPAQLRSDQNVVRSYAIDETWAGGPWRVEGPITGTDEFRIQASLTSPCLRESVLLLMDFPWMLITTMMETLSL